MRVRCPFANASDADLASLRRAFDPVYVRLAQDAQTKTFIQQIEELKRLTPSRPQTIPAGCIAAPSARTYGAVIDSAFWTDRTWARIV